MRQYHLGAIALLCALSVVVLGDPALDAAHARPEEPPAPLVRKAPAARGEGLSAEAGGDRPGGAAREVALGAALPTVADDLAQIRAVEGALVQMLDRVSRSTVTVLTRQRIGVTASDAEGAKVIAGAGSGVIIRQDGVWILTNAHVVQGQGQYEITTNSGRRIPVAVHAKDTAIDLALLKPLETLSDVDAIEIATVGTSELREGQWVVATGNPFLLAENGASAASLGVYSGARVGRRGSVDYLLQHDAEINPGSSGGPLWDLRGRLLGINGAIVTRSMRQGGGPSHTGASITIPHAHVRRFLDAAIGGRATTSQPTLRQPAVVQPAPAPEASRPPRGVPILQLAGLQRLGILGVTSLSDQGRYNGVLVTRVEPGTPAGRFLQPGDRIVGLSYQGAALRALRVGTLETSLAGLPGHAYVTLRYLRGGLRHSWTGSLR
jgi:S1-C subfamily serine protease